MTGNRDEIYGLAFTEGRRSVDLQASELELVRGRIGTLFSIAAIAAALPGDALIDRSKELGPVGVGALVGAALALVAMAVLVVVVWWPVGITVKLDSGILVSSYIEGEDIEGEDPVLLSDVHHDLALHLAEHLRSNRRGIDVKYRMFCAAAIAFVVEMALLLVAVLDIV